MLISYFSRKKRYFVNWKPELQVYETSDVVVLFTDIYFPLGNFCDRRDSISWDSQRPIHASFTGQEPSDPTGDIQVINAFQYLCQQVRIPEKSDFEAELWVFSSQLLWEQNVCKSFSGGGATQLQTFHN